MKKFGTFTVFDLLIHYIDDKRITLDKERIKKRAVYHDPCNYGRKAEKFFGHGYFEEPRWLMDQCFHDWVDLYPARRQQICCGGGGGTLLTGYNEARLTYGEKKMEQILLSGAELIVVPCHSCHGQLNGLINHMGIDHIEVRYLWEVIADIMIV